jgi:peptidoglycan/LPS O-acetylase OafA/YrhL
LALSCAATILLVVPVAAVTYYSIERPCSQFIRTLAPGRRGELSKAAAMSAETRIAMKSLLAAARK